MLAVKRMGSMGLIPMREQQSGPHLTVESTLYTFKKPEK